MAAVYRGAGMCDTSQHGRHALNCSSRAGISASDGTRAAASNHADRRPCETRSQRPPGAASPGGGRWPPSDPPAGHRGCVRGPTPRPVTIRSSAGRRPHTSPVGQSHSCATAATARRSSRHRVLHNQTAGGPTVVGRGSLPHERASQPAGIGPPAVMWICQCGDKCLRNTVRATIPVSMP